MNTAPRHSNTTNPGRRWRALRSRRRADRDWARAIARATTPSLHDELVLMRSLG